MARLLLLVTMGTGAVRHELMEHFSYDPVRVPTRSALCQQRAKLLPRALRRLLRKFASRLGLAEYRDGWALVAVDGSSLCFGPDRSDPATFHESREGTHGHNDVHAVALYDMVGGSYVDAVVQNGREKDEFRAMCDLVDDWPGWARGLLRAIFVGDRGFASYNVFAHVIEAGLHFRHTTACTRRQAAASNTRSWTWRRGHSSRSETGPPVLVAPTDPDVPSRLTAEGRWLHYAIEGEDDREQPPGQRQKNAAAAQAGGRLPQRQGVRRQARHSGANLRAL